MIFIENFQILEKKFFIYFISFNIFVLLIVITAP